MTRSDLIAELTASRLRQADAERIVQTVFKAIAQALARGDRVELRGFGVFTMKQRAARTVRNPHTGEAVSVAAQMVPYFRTGRAMHRRINRRG